MEDSNQQPDPTKLNTNLAINLTYIRKRRLLTQESLAKLTGIPRTTISNLETGEGNPTLSLLSQLSMALQISVEELLSYPVGTSRIYKKTQVKTLQRGGAEVKKLVPENIKGIEIDRFTLQAGSRMKGVPHRAGTREYLYCEKGNISLRVDGEYFDLSKGDVAAFQGDQRHSYENTGPAEAIGFSVVTLLPNKI